MAVYKASSLVDAFAKFRVSVGSPSSSFLGDGSVVLRSVESRASTVSSTLTSGD